MWLISVADKPQQVVYARASDCRGTHDKTASAVCLLLPVKPSRGKTSAKSMPRCADIATSRWSVGPLAAVRFLPLYQHYYVK